MGEERPETQYFETFGGDLYCISSYLVPLEYPLLENFKDHEALQLYNGLKLLSVGKLIKQP
jgi:hypothetical protein